MRETEITWSEFKQLVEEAGVGDQDRIDWIDYSSGLADSVKVTVIRDGLVRITEQYGGEK